MKPGLKPIIGALIFSTVLIASAYFLKGSPAKDWVQTVIYGVGIYFFFRYSIASHKKCPLKDQQQPNR